MIRTQVVEQIKTHLYVQ